MARTQGVLWTPEAFPGPNLRFTQGVLTDLILYNIIKSDILDIFIPLPLAIFGFFEFLLPLKQHTFPDGCKNVYKNRCGEMRYNLGIMNRLKKAGEYH